MLSAALMGRPGILFSGSFFARRFTSEGYPGASAFGVLAVVVEGAVAFVSDSVIRSSAKATVAAMSSSSSEGAMKELLNIMCDAVVQLDELDALLLRLPTAGAEPVTSLFVVTDQGRFVEFAARRDQITQSFHVKFRCDFALCFRAKLHPKRFKDVPGRTCHLIGMVEESGGSQLEMPTLPTTNKLDASRTGRGTWCERCFQWQIS